MGRLPYNPEIPASPPRPVPVVAPLNWPRDNNNNTNNNITAGAMAHRGEKQEQYNPELHHPQADAYVVPCGNLSSLGVEVSQKQIGSTEGAVDGMFSGGVKQHRSRVSRWDQP